MSTTAMTLPHATPGAPAWNRILAPYKSPVLWKSLFQLVTTAALYAFGWYLMVRSLEVGYWLTLLLAVPMAGLTTRLFIIQHDCGHGAFFRGSQPNHLVGFVLGVVTLTPYMYWR